jgi:excisionase family DNA binding protein
VCGQGRLNEPLLTVGEAARLLALSPRTLYAWVEAGRVPCVRIGRLVRFERSALNTLLDKEWSA